MQKFLNPVEFLATALTLSAAFVLAYMNQDAPFTQVFLVYCAGNVMFATTAVVRKAPGLVLVNLGFMVVNLIGIWRTL